VKNDNRSELVRMVDAACAFGTPNSEIHRDIVDRVATLEEAHNQTWPERDEWMRIAHNRAETLFKIRAIAEQWKKSEGIAYASVLGEKILGVLGE